ncbi:hypothetical protein EV715DRAFT_298383 [Schizophyllum commune]
MSVRVLPLLSRPTAQQARRHQQAHSRPPRRQPPEDASDKPDVAFDASPNDELVVPVGGRDSGWGVSSTSSARHRRLSSRAISDASTCAKKSHFDAKCAEVRAGIPRRKPRRMERGEGGGRRRGAPPVTRTTWKPSSRASSGHNFRKSTSIAPRPAP